MPLHLLNQTNSIVNQTADFDTEQQAFNSKLVNCSQFKIPGKPTRMIAEELLAEFKEAVEGSNLTKAGLVEVLKKQ